MTFAELITRFAELKKAGTYEQELLVAYRRHEGAVVDAGTLHSLFRSSDRARLRACGSPIPAGPWPRTVYRGVVGSGSVRGVSWSASLTVARFFALRPAPDGVQRQVWRALVDEISVYACLPLACEYLVDAEEVQLVEEGTPTIAAGLARDGIDAEALAIAREREGPVMDSTTRMLATRMGILRDDDTAPILAHLAGLLGSAGGRLR